MTAFFYVSDFLLLSSKTGFYALEMTSVYNTILAKVVSQIIFILIISIRWGLQYIRSHLIFAIIDTTKQTFIVQCGISIFTILIPILRHFKFAPLVAGTFARTWRTLNKIQHSRMCQTKKVISSWPYTDDIQRQHLIYLLQEQRMANIWCPSHYWRTVIIRRYFKSKNLRTVSLGI